MQITRFTVLRYEVQVVMTTLEYELAALTALQKLLTLVKTKVGRSSIHLIRVVDNEVTLGLYAR